MTTDLRDTVANEKVPALLIASSAGATTEKERAEIVTHCEARLAKVANHRVVLAPRAKHFVMLDAPDLV